MFDYRSMPNYPQKAGGASSAFLSGVGSGIAGPIGGAIGGALGSAFGGDTSNRTKVKFSGELADEAWRTTMSNAKKYGIHPLFALGAQPSSAGSGGFDLAGQSDLGSAVTEGIRSARQLSRHKQESQAARESQQAAQQIQTLKLQEQKLRNDWLATQIDNQKMKNASQAANAKQDVIKLSMIEQAQKPTQVRKQKKYEHSTPGQGYELFPTMSNAWESLTGTPFQLQHPPGKVAPDEAEDILGEFFNLMYKPFSLAEDLGYSIYHHDKEVMKKWRGTPYSLPKETPTYRIDKAPIYNRF